MQGETRTVWLDGIGAGTIVTAECYRNANGFYEPIVTRDVAADIADAIEQGYQGADIRIYFTWEGDDLVVWSDENDEVIDRISPDQTDMYRIVGFTFDIYDDVNMTPCPYCEGVGCKKCDWVGMLQSSALERGADMLDHYATLTNSEQEDTDTLATDLIADVLLTVRERLGDAEARAVLSRATMHYEYEGVSLD